MTLDSEARAPALATAPIQEERGALPYTPSWIHPLSDAIDRLPGPRWVAVAGIAMVGIVLQHAQL